MTQASQTTAPEELERILDLPLEITVELGRKRVRIAEMLELGVGAVVELDTPAGSPLSIYVNRVLVAHGEAVIVGERYGVKITEIVSPQERIRRIATPRGGL